MSNSYKFYSDTKDIMKKYVKLAELYDIAEEEVKNSQQD